MKKYLIIVSAIFILFVENVEADRYWTTVLSEWTLSLNNGVAYITSPQMPEHCTYSRAQINMSGTEFDKAQYSYVLSASKTKAFIQIVIDDTQTVCVASGVQEVQ